MSELNLSKEVEIKPKKKTRMRIIIILLILVLFVQVLILSDSYLKNNKGMSLLEYLKTKIASIFEVRESEDKNKDKYYKNFSFEKENKSKTEPGLLRIKTTSIVKVDSSGNIQVPIKNGSTFSASAVIKLYGKKVYKSRPLKPNETVVAIINVGKQSEVRDSAYDNKAGAYFYEVSLKSKKMISLNIKGYFIY